MIPTINVPLNRLPSKGVFYPEGVEVKYRAFTFGEIQTISSSKMSEMDILEMSMQGIDVKGMNKFLLTYNDYRYLLLARKLSMFNSEEVCINYKNPLTGKKENFVFKTSDIEFTDISVKEFPVNFEMEDGDFLSFMPLTLQDMFALMKDNKLEDDLAAMARMVKNKDYKTSYDFISNIHDAEDIATLEEILKLLDHSIKPFEVNCSDDKGNTKKIKIAPDRRQVHLLPFRGGKASKRNRISFGNKQHS